MNAYSVFSSVGAMIIALGPSVCAAASAVNLPDDRSIPRQSDGLIRQAANLEIYRTDTIEPEEIHEGFVILEGQYVSPPYLLQREQGKVYLNGVEIPQARRQPFAGGGFGMRRMSHLPPRQNGSRIAEHLRQDGMLICASDAPTAFAPVEQALAIFDVLLADKPQDAKIESLLQVVPRWTAPEQWTKLVETLEPPLELSDRLLALKQSRAESEAVDSIYDRPWAFLSGLTMTGFVLAVWALGTLLSCRPPLRRGWRGMSASGVCCRQVVWLVILIVVLNVYDLICTLCAHNVGGLWELNPFASTLVGYTSLIATFKIALTIGAGTLLLAARRNKLAQIGSWWAGVLYTVLIIRWATFNSMFL